MQYVKKTGKYAYVVSASVHCRCSPFVFLLQVTSVCQLSCQLLQIVVAMSSSMHAAVLLLNVHQQQEQHLLC